MSGYFASLMRHSAVTPSAAPAVAPAPATEAGITVETVVAAAPTRADGPASEDGRPAATAPLAPEPSPVVVPDDATAPSTPFEDPLETAPASIERDAMPAPLGPQDELDSPTTPVPLPGEGIPALDPSGWLDDPEASPRPEPSAASKPVVAEDEEPSDREEAPGVTFEPAEEAQPAEPMFRNIAEVRAWVSEGLTEEAADLPAIQGEAPTVAPADGGRTEDPRPVEEEAGDADAMAEIELAYRTAPAARDSLPDLGVEPDAAPMQVSIGRVELTVEAPAGGEPAPAPQSPTAPKRRRVKRLETGPGSRLARLGLRV